MPLKLNVGLCRKVGEPNYGSRGASIHVELEVDGALAQEPVKLQERIRQMFILVRNSLADELNGVNGAEQHANSVERPTPPVHGHRNHELHAQRGGSRQATPSQVKAIYGIARNQRLNLDQFLHDQFQLQRPEDLSVRQASQVIDDLRSMADENVN